MSFGSTKIGGAKFGNTLVFQPGGGVQPVMIPYIRGGADGSYIDTGITADNTVKMIVWARNFNPTTGFLFGSRTAVGEDAFNIGTHANTKTGLIRVDYAHTNDTYSSDAFAKLSGYHKYELYGGECNVDDTVIATATPATFGNAFGIHIIGNNNGGTHADVSLPIDICAAQIYKNGILVRDFTPVESPNAGLYDAVSDTVFTNAGTGLLTYGTFNRNAYTPLEYIGTTDAQYFDSGIIGTYALPVVCEFTPTNSIARWHSVLGYRATGSNFEISLGVATSGNNNTRLYWRFGTNDSVSTVFTGSSSNKLTNKKVIAVKTNGTLTAFYAAAQIGTASKTESSSFQTNGNLFVCGYNTENGIKDTELFSGLLYFLGFGTLRNFVPGEVGGVAGMYDTYHDTFYPSASATPFIAGPTI